MVILIGGASHTGKTCLAQRLLERLHYPYISIDHLKMGLIRSGQTTLTPLDDEALMEYLWPILREMIKTAVENRQNLILEGCYIPFSWREDFTEDYLAQIRCVFLVMSRNYIVSNFEDILAHGCDVEARLDESGLCPQSLQEENERNLSLCEAHGCAYILIDGAYEVEAEYFRRYPIEDGKDREEHGKRIDA